MIVFPVKATTEISNGEFPKSKSRRRLTVNLGHADVTDPRAA
jgi:hypothetical protein